MPASKVKGALPSEAAAAPAAAPKAEGIRLEQPRIDDNNSRAVF
jgi:hypothetical protein